MNAHSGSGRAFRQGRMIVVACLTVLLGLQVGFSFRSLMGEVHTVNARAAEETSEWEAALWSLEQAVSWNPYDYNHHFRLGLFLDQFHDERASTSFENCMNLAPNYLPAMFALAENYVDSGDFEAATELIDRGLEIVPRYWRIHLLAARNSQRNGDHDRAIDRFQEAIRLSSPPSSQLMGYLGVSLYALGRLNAAHDALEQAISIDPELAENHLLFGKILAAEGRTEQAFGAYVSAVNLTSAKERQNIVDRATLQAALYEVCATGVELDRVIPSSEYMTTLARLNAEYPRLEELATKLAHAVDRQLKHQEAPPQAYGGALFNVGSVFSRLARWEEADRYYAKAMPRLAGLQYEQCARERCNVLLRLQRYDKAAQVARSALDKGRASLDLSLILGEALAQAGRNAEARLEFVGILSRFSLSAEQQAAIKQRVAELTN